MEKSDIESGGITVKELYPAMNEMMLTLGVFIRKVYIILSLQMMLTLGVSVGVFFVRAIPIPIFITTTYYGLAVFFVSLVLPLLRYVSSRFVFVFVIHWVICLFMFARCVGGFNVFAVLWPLFAFEKKHPVNLIILTLFTLSVSFAVGLCCSFSKGKIVLEAAILTAAMVLGLTIYTFWAVKRGHDFSFLGPFLFGALLIVLVFSLMQIFHPLGKLSSMIFSGLASILFCGYIIYDTNQLIKKHKYDDYIPAAIALYLDIINLFLNLIGVISNTQ